MAMITAYPYTPDELTNLANHIKDNLAYSLYNDGVIDDPSVIGEHYVVVISQSGFLGRMLAKLRGEDLKDERLLNIAVLKTIPPKKTEVTGNVEENRTSSENNSD